MKISKRHLLWIIPMLCYGGCQMEWFKFRMDEARQTRYLLQKGVRNVGLGTFQSGLHTTHLIHVGDTTKPLIVFVHGSPGSSSAVLDYLADTVLLKSAQMVAIDRPGFGFSSFGKVQPSLEKQAEAVIGVVRLFPCRPVVLVGHSYGGAVICRAAMDYPEEVDGLVVVAGSIDPDLEPNPWWQRPLASCWLRWMLPPAFRVSNDEILALQNELRQMLPRWGEIKCPVVVVQGLQDKLVDPGNAAFAERTLIAASRVEVDTIPDQGHFIFWNDRGRIVNHIVRTLGLLNSCTD